MSVRILGVDPGIKNTGFGVVESVSGRIRALQWGVIVTASELPLEQRLVEIHHDIGELIERHEIDAVAIEELYFGANVRTAFAVGQAKGVVLLACAEHDLTVTAYTPQQIKSAVCGSGRAEKDQVQRMVGRLLSIDPIPSPDHAADALAAAICECNRSPLAAALARGRRAASAANGRLGD